MHDQAVGRYARVTGRDGWKASARQDNGDFLRRADAGAAGIDVVVVALNGVQNAAIDAYHNRKRRAQVVHITGSVASCSDTFVFMQKGEPGSLYCADESDGEALRACEQTMEGLYGFEENGTAPVPSLATGCTSNDELTVWTCTLRDGVKFQDGSDFTAQDVLVSLAAQWDAAFATPQGRDRCVLVLAGPVGRLPQPARTVRDRGSACLHRLGSAPEAISGGAPAARPAPLWLFSHGIDSDRS